MKYRVYTFSIALLLSLCQCSKDNVTPAAIDQLPAATQEGKNTFGCLVDGQVFLLYSNPLAGVGLKCAYQYINFSGTRGYVFLLSAPGRTGDINITTDSFQIGEGNKILLNKKRNGGASAVYSILNDNLVFTNFITDDTLNGELTITKFDMIKLIASGTFWFNAIDTISGKTVKVTDGRFDMHFSQ